MLKFDQDSTRAISGVQSSYLNSVYMSTQSADRTVLNFMDSSAQHREMRPKLLAKKNTFSKARPERTLPECQTGKSMSSALRKQQRHYPTCETCMSTTSFSIPNTSHIRHALICVLILVYLTKSLLEYTPVQRLRHGIIKFLSLRISCIGVLSHRIHTFSGSFTRTLIVPFRHISAGFAQSIYAPKETYPQILSDI